MAARHLQKLRVQDVPQLAAQDVDASESEEEIAAPLNPFDLLDDNEVSNLPHVHIALKSTAHRHTFVFRTMTAGWMTPPLRKMVLQQSSPRKPRLKQRPTQQRRKRKPDKSKRKSPTLWLAQDPR